MPAELLPCYVEAVRDDHEADVIVHSVFQHLDNILSSGSQQRRTRSQAYDPALIVNFLNEQLLHAPLKVFAATAWLQAKGLDISSLYPESTLQAINDSNKRLIATVTEAKKKAYKTHERKRNHLDRIEKLLQRPLTDIFNHWTSEVPSDPSQLAVGTLAAIERAVALSPHLTPDEISIALNTAVNGPGVSNDQLGQKPSQTLIQALCHRLESNSSRTPINTNAREVNPRLRRFLGQKRQVPLSPSTSVSKRPCASFHDSSSSHNSAFVHESPSPERGRHAVTPLSDSSANQHPPYESFDEDDGNIGAHDHWDDVSGVSGCDNPSHLIESGALGIQSPTQQLIPSDLEKTPSDHYSDRSAGCQRTIGTDELITPPRSRQLSTIPFASFPGFDAMCDSPLQTISDLQDLYHKDLENDLRKDIGKSKALTSRLQPELEKKWQAYLLKQSEHETAIRRVGVELESRPGPSRPPSLPDVRQRKDGDDAQDKRTGELISDIERRRREKQKALNHYEQWRMMEDKEAEIMAGLEALLQKTQEVRRLTEGLRDEV